MALPNFIIGGERKCATTSLMRWMATHPDVFMLSRQDPGFFLESELVAARAWRDGEPDAAAWDRTHSAADLERMFAAAGNQRCIAFKDADLMFWRPSHARMARMLPDCRYLFVLREPTSRAWSHYWDEFEKGRETETFDVAIECEAARSARSAYARDHLSYVARGCYDDTLGDLFEHVRRDRVMLLTLDELYRSPQDTLRRVYQFVGVDPEAGLEAAGSVHNKSRAVLRRPWADNRLMRAAEPMLKRVAGAVAGRVGGPSKRKAAKDAVHRLFNVPAATRQKMSPATRERLRELYRPHTQRLAEMTGLDVSGWNRAS